MAQTQRKQVLAPGQLISSLASQTNKATPVIAGSLHGLVKDLTVLGTGFEPTP